MAKGQPMAIYYDKLMLKCEQKNIGRVLLPTMFFSNKANLVHICSSMLRS